MAGEEGLRGREMPKQRGRERSNAMEQGTPWEGGEGRRVLVQIWREETREALPKLHVVEWTEVLATTTLDVRGGRGMADQWAAMGKRGREFAFRSARSQRGSWARVASLCCWRRRWCGGPLGRAPSIPRFRRVRTLLPALPSPFPAPSKAREAADAGPRAEPFDVVG